MHEYIYIYSNQYYRPMDYIYHVYMCDYVKYFSDSMYSHVSTSSAWPCQSEASGSPKTIVKQEPPASPKRMEPEKVSWKFSFGHRGSL